MNLNHLIQRSVLTLFMIWSVASLSFLLVHALPGDPVDMILGDQASNADRVAMRIRLGLDLSITEQYGNFLRGLAIGDWGESVLSHRPIRQEIFERLPNTFMLALFAVGFATLLSIPLGIYIAVFPNQVVAKGIQSFCILGVSIPSFFLAPLLILFFCVKLQWLPISGDKSFATLCLPALTLSVGLTAVLIQFTRQSFAQVLHQDYMRVARARGVPPWKLYLVHALKNAMSPILSVLGLQLGALLSGALVMETIFDWPGLGTLLYEAVQSRNYPLVQYSVLVTAFIYAAVNLCIDVAQVILQPRLRA